MPRYLLLLPIMALVLTGVLGGDGSSPAATAAPGAVTFRDRVFGLPHIYAGTDVELAREYGREIAKDRLGQLIWVSRVARGTLYQALGSLDPGTLDDDIAARRQGYTSSELNDMLAKTPADFQAQVLAYCEGVNDTIDAIYAGELPEPLEVSFLRDMGLDGDLFGNATNISDQVDPFYRAPGGADPERPHGGFQFTPELNTAIAVLQLRHFGTAGFGPFARIRELDALLNRFPATGDEIWDDLNFLNDPLAPVSVPDPTTPGFGGPLAGGPAAGSPSASNPAAVAELLPDSDYDAALEPPPEGGTHQEKLARRLGAWPALGSYAWVIDGERSATGNPWLGGFPQTGIQTPSIMHYVEMRSGEGADHRIQAAGMGFAGTIAVLVGQTDNVAWSTMAGKLQNMDYYKDRLVMEKTNLLRYQDEGVPAPMNKRVEIIRDASGASTPVIIWRTHERAGNGGSRTVEPYWMGGDTNGTTDSATPTSLVDCCVFSGDYSGGYIVIKAGTGAGQMRPILSNTSSTVTLAPSDAWTTTPNATSEYVAAKAGHVVTVSSEDRTFWLEETTTGLGISLLQRAESVLDIRRGVRLMPTSLNYVAADNQPFNGVGTDLGPSGGNIGYWSAGFSRVRQGASPTDERLPLDGAQPNELVVVGGTVGSATVGTLTSAGAFAGRDFSPPPFNYRLDNPTEQGREYIVTITGGGGYKQTRRITSNTNDTLTLEEDWGVVPSPGDLFEVYEIVATPEAINPPQGYTANWNNKAATADDALGKGRQFRNIFILERLAADSSWTRDEQRQLNKDVAGLDDKGKIGRYLLPRLREAVDAVGNGGNPDVDTVLTALEEHNDSPWSGRRFIDPAAATTVAGEVAFLRSLLNHLWTAIYGDELAGTGIQQPAAEAGDDIGVIQHAIDSAAGGPAGAYVQKYSGDYFNGVDWRVVVRDALHATIEEFGMPTDSPRPQSTYVHFMAALYPDLVFDPTPGGNRGTWEQIIEVGPTVLGEFIFPLGQSAFIDSSGVPDPNADSLHRFWRDWRLIPMLHVAEDLATDPDGDVDDDGVLDGFEKWYFGSNSPAATDDADLDGLNLLGEYLNATDPTQPDTDTDGCKDGAELGPDEKAGGRRDPQNLWDYFNPTGDGQNRIDDILAIVNHYFIDEGQPGYDSRYDRTYVGPNDWNLGPPNGQIRIDDILHAVHSYFHDCA